MGTHFLRKRNLIAERLRFLSLDDPWFLWLHDAIVCLGISFRNFFGFVFAKHDLVGLQQHHDDNQQMSFFGVTKEEGDTTLDTAVVSSSLLANGLSSPLGARHLSFARASFEAIPNPRAPRPGASLFFNR